MLDQPPVWDASMAVFPAAITLADMNFDLAGLLQQPGYFHGGPNVHSTSLVTHVTALAYWALGDRPGIVLPFLHVLHFLVGAGILLLFWRLARPLLGAALGSGFVLALFSFPMLNVQMGYLYTELPLLFCAALAIHEGTRGRTVRASAWATVAVWVKPSGAIVAGALILYSLCLERPWKERWRGAALQGGPPALASAAIYWFRPPDRLDVGSLRVAVENLLSVPDVALLLVLFPFLSVGARPWRGVVGLRRCSHGGGDPREHGGGQSGERREDAIGPGQDPERLGSRIHLACLALWISFLVFYFLLKPLGVSVWVLPRYYLLLVPFALLSTLAIMERRSRRLAVIVLVTVSIFFLANRRGHLYPRPDSTNFAVAERSLAYVDLLELEIRTLRELAARGETDPVFYGLPEHYKLAYPEMGYGVVKPAEGHYILGERPYAFGRLADFPPSFHMSYESPMLGGEIVARVAARAEESSRWEVAVTPLEVGRFRSFVFHVRRRPETPISPAPSASDPPPSGISSAGETPSG